MCEQLHDDDGPTYVKWLVIRLEMEKYVKNIKWFVIQWIINLINMFHMDSINNISPKPKNKIKQKWWDKQNRTANLFSI